MTGYQKDTTEFTFKVASGALLKAKLAYSIRDTQGSELLYAERYLTELAALPVQIAVILIIYYLMLIVPGDIRRFVPVSALAILILTLYIFKKRRGANRSRSGLINSHDIILNKVTRIGRVGQPPDLKRALIAFIVEDINGANVLIAKKTKLLTGKNDFNLTDGTGKINLGKIEPRFSGYIIRLVKDSCMEINRLLIIGLVLHILRMPGATGREVNISIAKT